MSSDKLWRYVNCPTSANTFVIRVGVLLEGATADVPDELACMDDDDAARSFSFSFSFPHPGAVVNTLTNGLMSRPKPELEVLDAPEPAWARLDDPDDVDVAGAGQSSDNCAAVAGWKLGRGL